MAHAIDFQQVTAQVQSLRQGQSFFEAEQLISDVLKKLPLSRHGVTKSYFDTFRGHVANLSASRAYCRVKMDRLVDALSDAERACDFYPEDSSFPLLVAHICYLIGDLERAKQLADSLAHDEDASVVQRADALKARICVDEKYAVGSKDVNLVESEGYSHSSTQEEFERFWDPIRCPSCSQAFPRSNLDDIVPLADNLKSCENFVLVHCGLSCDSVVRLDAMQRSRVCTHLPTLTGVLSTTVSLCGGSSSTTETVNVYAACVLAYQFAMCFPKERLMFIADAFATHNRSNKERGSEERSTRSSLCFASQRTASAVVTELTLRLRSITAQLSTKGNGGKGMQRFANLYEAAERFLQTYGFDPSAKRCGIDPAATVAVRERVNEASRFLQQSRRPSCGGEGGPSPNHLLLAGNDSVTVPLAVAVDLFPLAVALFGVVSGDVAQRFHSSQQRRAQPPKGGPDGEEEDSADCEGPSTREHDQPASTLFGDLFRLPLDAADAVVQLARVAAPIVSRYRLKRSLSEGKVMITDFLTSFVPPEIHGTVRKCIDDRLILTATADS